MGPAFAVFGLIAAERYINQENTSLVTTDTSDSILQRMMTLHPKVIDLTLDRVLTLLERLGNPQDKLPQVIHIAGTNGKGSTLAMIRAGLESMGKRCHVYTSPHLVKFHERITIAGEVISEVELAALLDECERLNAGAPITYFEITTCAAFLAFARHKADYCLLEVGLGGRLDATNVIASPAMTVITPISKDHEQYLGNSIAEIAGEKGGILKRGVPCVVAEQVAEASQVIGTLAIERDSPLLQQGEYWTIDSRENQVMYRDQSGQLSLPLPRLIGAHQVVNAGAAVTVLRQLWADDIACVRALRDPQWPARMQSLENYFPEVPVGGEVWLDGGHNEAAGAALAAVLADMPSRATYLICGMLNSKSVTGFLAPLASRISGVTGIAIPQQENAFCGEFVANCAAELGINADSSDNFRTALSRIFSRDRRARVLICGSLYLAGEVLREIKKNDLT